jgi:hypothetical protein
MSKLDELKVKLIIFKRTRSISTAVDICDWLVNELKVGGDSFGGNGKTTDATPTESTIEDK